MKRKGRKSKTVENSNGVTARENENGDASDQDKDYEPEDRPRKGSKRKGVSKKAGETSEDSTQEDADDSDDKRRKSKRKSAPKKGEGDSGKRARENSKEPEEERVKNKRKSATRKLNDTYEEAGSDNSEEPEEKKKKPTKGKKGGKKEESTEEPQYEVEQVLDEKMIQGVRHYLIRWKGYEPESDTWEPESTLNCWELISEFKAKKKKKNKTKTEQKRGRKKTKSDQQPTWDENQDFEVDRILDVYFKRNGQREFLVSWKGYPPSQNSWEPEENMDCKELIQKFMEKVERAKESDQRELRVKRTHTDRLTLMTTGGGRRLSKRNMKKISRIHYYDAE